MAKISVNLPKTNIHTLYYYTSIPIIFCFCSYNVSPLLKRSEDMLIINRPGVAGAVL